MKPKKNTIFCYGCHRSKMLFETKSKADNFIKFNKDNILEENGYAPVRSYYCEFCCGYHVTSNSSVETGERLDEKEHEFLMQFSATDIDGFDLNNYYNETLNKISQAESQMYVGDFKLLEQLYEEINELRIKYKVLLRLPAQKREKFLLLSQKIDSLRNRAIKIREIAEKDDEVLNDYLSCEQPSEEQMSLIPIIKGLLFMRQVIKEIDAIQILIDEGNIAKALELKNKLRHTVAVREDVRKNMKTECNKIINGVEHRIAQKRKEILAATPPIEEEKPSIIPFQEQYSYKSSMVEIINLIEEIKSCFDKGDIDLCETKIDVADLLFSKIDVEDANTDLIRSYIEMWKHKIRDYEDS